MKHSPSLIGIALAVLGTIFFTLMGICVKLLPTSISNNTIIFARFFVGLILLIPWIAFDRQFSFKINHPFIFILRNITGLISMACLYFAIKYIPLGNAILLVNTFPLFIPLFVWILFKIKTSLPTVLAIILGFCGILVILEPKSLFVDKVSLIAIFGGISTAFSFILLRQSAKHNSTSQLLFYFFLTGSLISAFLMLFDWHPLTRREMGLLIGVGLFGSLFQVVVTKALAYGSARATAPIMYLSVVFGGIADWLVWYHVPQITTIIGSTIVIFAGIIITLRSQKEVVIPPPAPPSS